MKLHRLIYLFLCQSVFAQSDDFSEGVGKWFRFDPLSELVGDAFASVTVEDGACRISAVQSPAPSMAGPARAGLFRHDVAYADQFFVSVDLKVVDPHLKQAIGLFIFGPVDPALGAIDGYSVSFQPADQDLVINRITAEAPTRIAAADLAVESSDEVRLVVLYNEGVFTALLFDQEDLRNPICQVSAEDHTYQSGYLGLFVFSDTDDGSGQVDAVFDNYVANGMQAPVLDLQFQGEDEFTVSWPDWAVHYELVSSRDLSSQAWDLQLGAERVKEAASFRFCNEVDEEVSRFFRLERVEF
ncbi:hypothetical protein V2O64_08380 [Verrucomicrobiaceae bacterium 227]